MWGIWTTRNDYILKEKAPISLGASRSSRSWIWLSCGQHEEIDNLQNLAAELQLYVLLASSFLLS
jgi:hypothetical protein